MDLKSYLETKKMRVAEFARQIGVRQCVARRWALGEAIPNKDSMQKIYEWSGGSVEPNDFYNVGEE